MVLSRWSTWKMWTILIFLYISSCCHASEQQPATAVLPPVPSEAQGNPNHWLKNTHSTTCAHNSVRTFLVDTREGDALSLVIRQNVQGTIVVKELPKKPASSHKVQVALNWTASNSDILDALHNSYKIIEVGDEKLVLIEVYVGDVESKTNLSPVVVGGTVTGFLVMMGLIIVGLYMARRKSNASAASMADSQDLSSQADDDEDDDTDYYQHPSSYLAGSHGGEDMSLNLSMMRDMMEASHDTHMGTLPSHPSNQKMQASVGSMRSMRSRKSGKDDEDLPPPPPPPPEFEFGQIPPPPPQGSDFDGSPPQASSSASNIPQKLSNPSQSPSKNEPVYAVVNKQRGAAPSTAPKPMIALPNAQSTESDSDCSGMRPGSGGGGGGSGYLGSSLLGRTVMIVGILSIVCHSVYTLCLEDISVEVLIFIPQNAKISNIQLYTNREKPAVFQETSWYLENKKLFKTYDVDDASSGEEIKHCSPKLICPTATNSTLVGCDWKTQKCVCSRGWQMNNRQTCVDVDECEINRCPPNMTCTNYPGTYSCACKQGTFWNGQRCQACTIGCPEGLYQVRSCTTDQDRSCLPCTQCTGGTFTFKPCTSLQDSQCMDVAQPYIQYPNAVKIKKNQVAVKSSSNIFVEELHKTQDLSYPLFVSDNNQIMNFVWQRTSGIRVLIKVSDFNIIPDFEDVTHQNDNLFVQQLMPQQKTYLNKIVYNYCRSPVPDYYMLTMNKYKDRTTVVRDIVCNTTLKNCPPRFSNGQTYRFRTYNTQCPKTSIEVNRLSNEGNSIVCNERTPLLADVFNETLEKENPLTFPSLDCKQAIWKCKQCFSDNKCGDMGEGESCCAVSCHAHRFCKQAASDACSAAPEECATGDTVQFIVQPYFDDLGKQFMCHLRRRKPVSIFKLSYQVIVPTPEGWNSSRREVDLPTTGESEASQRYEYINVRYNNYLHTSDDGEMMLRGDYNYMRREFDFSLFDFKPRSEFNKTRVRPVKYETSRNRETMNVNIQNERPFDISTWNFNAKHGCYADTSKIHGKQNMYNNETGQHVQMYMLKDNEGFRYKVRSIKDTPRVDFHLAANESILYHYFSNSSLDHNSVEVKLVDKAEPFYIYSIQVTGSMRSCNSYLGIHIFDKTTESTVAMYDTLVYCLETTNNQPTFEFGIKIPATGSKNKLFSVTLKDSYTSVSYFVTTYSYQSSLLQNNTVSLQAVDGKTTSEPAAFFAMLSVLAITGFAFGLLYVMVSYRCIVIARFRGVEDECVYQTTRMRLVVALYFISKLVYSVILSFSVFLLVLQLVCSKDTAQVKELSDYHIAIKQLVERNIQAITEFKRLEVDRQNSMQSQRLKACSGYAQQSVLSLRSYVTQFTEDIGDKKQLIENQKFELLMAEIQQHLEATKVHVDLHKKNTDTQIADILLEYNTLLEEITTNSWLQIPLTNFKAMSNDTIPASRRRGRGEQLSEHAVDFLAYLGVDRPSAVLRQIQLLNERLESMYQMMRLDIDNNIGLSILRGLDTSSVSKLSLKKFDTEISVSPPAFNIEADIALKSGGSTIMAWIVVIFCDILLFTYRMASASSTIYRLRNGYTEEVEDNSQDEKEIEMQVIKSNDEGEMTRSLLAHAEHVDENHKFHEAPAGMSNNQTSKQSSQNGSRVPSETGSVRHSDLEQPRNGKNSEKGSIGRNSRLSQRPGSAMSEPVSSRSDRTRPRGNSKPASVAGSLRRNPMSMRVRQQAPSASDSSKDDHSRTQSTEPPGSDMRTELYQMQSNGDRTVSSTNGNTHTVQPGSDNSEDKVSHPGGCAASRLGRLLLSEYTIPAIMWLTAQVLAIILISLLTEIVTYNSLVQVTNVDSMISHIGMYASVVNSYLTTHAQAVSKMAQDTMVQEFNQHLHHIAKVKAIFESDLNWSLLDYSNKQCVLDGKLIEHCTYQPIQFDFSVMPCQSFPIEAKQYTENEGINAQLVAGRMQSYTNSLISLISTSISMLVFYINAVAIIHIISLVLNTILHRKGLLHIITVRFTRKSIPVIEIEEKEDKTVLLPPSSTMSDSVIHTSQSPSDIMVNALLMDKQLRNAQRFREQQSIDKSDTDHGSNNNGSLSKIPNKSSARRSMGDEEDPLLRTIKAQHSITKQLTDELSESSARSHQLDKVGGASNSFDQKDSETEF